MPWKWATDIQTYARYHKLSVAVAKRNATKTLFEE
jgi:hypothetical protein